MRPGIVAITGANGFLGSVLSAHFSRAGYPVREVVRPGTPERAGVARHEVADLLDAPALARALEGAWCVLHFAGLAHRKVEGDGPDSPHHRVNVEGTRAVTEAAARAGVTRIVAASSIKAVADVSSAPLTAATRPAPTDPYGRSKLAAEDALHERARQEGMAAVSLRLPLVYGPGVGANMLKLVRAVAAGLPLPFASVRNRRSFLYTGNLCAAVETALEIPVERSGRYFVRDGADLSTPDLLALLARALGRSPRLLPFPPRLLETVLGDSPLTTSLFVDDAPLRGEGYVPPCTPQQGIDAMVRWYGTTRGART